MQALEAIMTRRSIREFQDKPVEKELIEKLLRAAMRAPSAGNQQPWWFIVVEDRKKLESISDFHPYAKMCRQAALAIVVCGDPSMEKHPGFWVQDCAAAVENLLLAAHSLGLGAVWTGVYPRDDRASGTSKLFGLPTNVIPFAIIPIGWPTRKHDPIDTFVKERIFLNKWGAPVEF